MPPTLTAQKRLAVMTSATDLAHWSGEQVVTIDQSLRDYAAGKQPAAADMVMYLQMMRSFLLRSSGHATLVATMLAVDEEL